MFARENVKPTRRLSRAKLQYIIAVCGTYILRHLLSAKLLPPMRSVAVISDTLKIDQLPATTPTADVLPVVV